MSKLYSSLISIVLSFLIVAVILQLAGLYPLEFIASLVRGATGINILEGTFSVRYIGTFIVTVVPILLTGISVSFAFKTGLFNIGAEGQFIVGSLTAVFLGLSLDLPPVIFPIVIIIASGLVGGLWGAIPGFLKAFRNVHEVVICIMLNYIAMYTANLYYTNVEGFKNAKTPSISENATLKSTMLESLTDNSRLNWGILIAIIALVIYYILINKSTLGYKLKVIGFNHEAAKYSGINVKSGMVQSMAISGAFSGIGGAILVLGTFYYGRELSVFENYGFDGLSVALVGGGNAIGILFASLLFATLTVSKSIMQIYGIPIQIASLISGIIVFFISLSLITDEKMEKRRLKKKYAIEKKEDK
ncbi:MAG: ABC transporter permease [Bacilli bacterium]